MAQISCVALVFIQHIVTHTATVIASVTFMYNVHVVYELLYFFNIHLDLFKIASLKF